MADVELVDVSIAGPDVEALAAFTRLLIEQRLAACGNIYPGVRSIYRWEGAVEDEGEAVVVLHTRADLVPKIVEAADKHHPYDVPQVLAVPVVGAHPGYRQWVIDSTTDTP